LTISNQYKARAKRHLPMSGFRLPKRCLGVSRDPAQADNFTRVSSKLTTGSYPLSVPSRVAVGMLIIVVMTGRRRKSKAGEGVVLAIASRR
jgi:hypothetical protein